MATLTAGFIWAPEDAPVTRIPTKKKSFVFGKIFLVTVVEIILIFLKALHGNMS